MPRQLKFNQSAHFWNTLNEAAFRQSKLLGAEFFTKWKTSIALPIIITIQMAFQLVLFVRMFMILIIDNYKRCVLIKSMFITKGMNTSNEIYRRKDIYTFTQLVIQINNPHFIYMLKMHRYLYCCYNTTNYIFYLLEIYMHSKKLFKMDKIKNN